MGTLSLALYCEGETDKRFLPPVIQETSRFILHKYYQVDVEVMPVQIIETEKKKQHEAILLAAHLAHGYHALVIHADADGPEAEEAKKQRFVPGYNLVRQSPTNVCKDLLPIIPVQAIEAWMLADYELLLNEIGTDLRPVDLKIPINAGQVETISRPKQRLKQAVQIAYAKRTRRQRDTDIDFLYELMGEKINLERLNMVPSYTQFVHDLTEVLQQLHFIS